MKETLTGIMMKDHAQYYFDKSREFEDKYLALRKEHVELKRNHDAYREGFIEMTRLYVEEFKKVQRLEKALEKKVNQVNALTRQNEYMDEKIKTAEEICLRGE